jgi:adenosylcobinamide kinase/adenosylcobinamide-phosphate guanylyltransferase
MGNLILITGGARSGKSSYAESLADQMAGEVLFIATATPFDDEMQDRIAKHRRHRPAHWETYEGYRDLQKVFYRGDYSAILLDCVTMMISNLIYDSTNGNLQEKSAEEIGEIETMIKNEIKQFLDEAERRDLTLIIVTNELGSGIVPANKLTRVFRDIAGRMNQYIASRASEVYLLVCGLPQRIK